MKEPLLSIVLWLFVAVYRPNPYDLLRSVHWYKGKTDKRLASHQESCSIFHSIKLLTSDVHFGSQLQYKCGSFEFGHNIIRIWWKKYEKRSQSDFLTQPV